jgi:hypothetical protein
MILRSVLNKMDKKRILSNKNTMSARKKSLVITLEKKFDVIE